MFDTGLATHSAAFLSSSKRRFRKTGMPPPTKFDFDALPDSAWLTTEEVAAVLRRAKGTVEMWRQPPRERKDGKKVKTHPLAFERVDGKPLYRVSAVRAYIASNK